MICPHGDHTLEVPGYAELNVESYGKSAKVITLCCGKMVMLSRYIHILASRSDYLDTLSEDDWGRKRGCL
jgi:hypothetical protein